MPNSPFRFHGLSLCLCFFTTCCASVNAESCSFSFPQGRNSRELGHVKIVIKARETAWNQHFQSRALSSAQSSAVEKAPDHTLHLFFIQRTSFWTSHIIPTLRQCRTKFGPTLDSNHGRNEVYSDEHPGPEHCICQPHASLGDQCMGPIFTYSW